MIILKLQAGLGNQMFQYAYGRALALRSSKAFNEHIPLCLDLYWYDHQAPRDTKRFYGLNHFNIDAKILTETEVKRERGILEARPFQFLAKLGRRIKRMFGWSDYVYYESAARPVKNKSIDGYWWNSESYFADYADVIRKDFTLKEPLGAEATKVKAMLEEKAKEKTLVVIQARRGDYLTNVHANSFHGAKGAEYFDQAIKMICSKLPETHNFCFVLVSDDIVWAKENIVPKDAAGNPFPVEVLSRPGLSDYEELYLMSLAHHFIISNSTFSWWGAWLSTNPGKIVIGPGQWVNDAKVDTRDVMPTSWIRI